MGRVERRRTRGRHRRAERRDVTGCATRLGLADGRRLFVKAVGPELNPDTPTLFRREAYALGLLGHHPLWAGLVDVLDETDGWVALLLDDVPGAHPDLTDDAQMRTLLAATDALVGAVRERVGTPPPARPGADLMDTRQVVLRWAEYVDLIRRCDGTLVFVGWGAASRGPAWADPLLSRLERVEEPFFDDSIADSPALAALGEEHRRESTRFLEGARRRVGEPVRGIDLGGSAAHW